MPSVQDKYRIFTNYRSAMEFARSYKKNENIPPSSELITHINKIVLKKFLDDWEAGRSRNFSERPNEIYDTWYKHFDYHPNVDVNIYFDEIYRYKPGAGHTTLTLTRPSHP